MKIYTISIVLTILSLTLVGTLQNDILGQTKKGLIDSDFSANLTANKTEAYELALTLYDEALSNEPNATDILTNKGIVLTELHKYGEAVKVFDNILSLDPSNIDGLFNKAIALEKMNMTEEARKYYNMALEIDPSYKPDLASRLSTSLDAKQSEPSVEGQSVNNSYRSTIH